MNGQRDIDNLVKIVKRNGGDWLEGGHGIPVMIGNLAGEVDAGFGKVYVRFGNGKVEKVLNNGAPLAFDWHATVGHLRSQPSIWRIREVRYTYLETPDSFVQAHAPQHELGGFDQIAIDRRLITSATLLVSNSANFLVRVYGGLFPVPGGWVLGESTDGDAKPDVDLSSYVPAAGAQYISVEYDETGAIFINDSAPIKDAKELLDTKTDVAPVVAGHRLIDFVMLYEGQPTLLNEHIYPPGLFMPDYASVETGYQIDNAPAGTPVNPDKFGFWSVGDAQLEYIAYKDLIALINGAISFPELLTDDDCNILFDDDCELLYGD